jgi:Fe2+ transport system protein FeoA
MSTAAAVSTTARSGATSLPVMNRGLHEVEVGGAGTVTAVAGDPGLRRRLMEMGFCRGTRVEVVRRSPFGDPIELRLRGYCLSLRCEQARCVCVE